MKNVLFFREGSEKLKQDYPGFANVDIEYESANLYEVRKAEIHARMLAWIIDWAGPKHSKFKIACMARWITVTGLSCSITVINRDHVADFN